MKRWLILIGIFSLLVLIGSAFYQQSITQVEVDEDDLLATGVVSIPAVAFRPAFSSDDMYLWFATHNHGAGCLENEGNSFQMYAPVHLPQNATITKLVAYVKDDTHYSHLSVSLLRARSINPAGDCVLVASASTTGETPFSGIYKIIDTTIDYPLVKNNSCYYFVTLYLSSETLPVQERGEKLRLYGVKITYE